MAFLLTFPVRGCDDGGGKLGETQLLLLCAHTGMAGGMGGMPGMPGRPRGEVNNKRYYEVLGVSPDASDVDIKKVHIKCGSGRLYIMCTASLCTASHTTTL